MALSAEQRRIAKKIIRIGRRRREPRRLIVSALSTGLTESGLRNLRYGDADSQGWRQERAQYYSNPTNLRASINRYYDEAKTDVPGGSSKRNLKTKSIAEISQAIQASAFPSRYAENAPEARAIFSRLSGSTGAGSSAGAGGRQKASQGRRVTIPGVSYAAERQAAALDLIRNRHEPGAFISYAKTVQDLKDIKSRTYIKPGDKNKLNDEKVRKGEGSHIDYKGERLRGGAIEVGTKVAKMFGLTVTSTTGGNHAPGSYHYSGRAIDISGSPAQMRKAYRYLRRNLPHRKLTELFYDPAGVYFNDGKKIRGALGSHSDHIHLAI